jgi:hypothetical protein
MEKVIRLLFARSDLMSVSIPVTSGGCGSSHSRPVRNGKPEKDWELNCNDCESYLKGARKPRILKTTPGDPKLGIPAKQERVADCDPHWSSTPDSVPMTPDEAQHKHLKIERGEQQLRALESLATLAKAGINYRDRPDVLYFLREQHLPEDMLQGSVLCSNGHDNAPGAKFCSECAVSMNGQKEIESVPEPVTEIPLDMLHIATLRKKCRESGLPDKGKKEEMITRLQAARSRVPA